MFQLLLILVCYWYFVGCTVTCDNIDCLIFFLECGFIRRGFGRKVGETGLLKDGACKGYGLYGHWLVSGVLCFNSKYFTKANFVWSIIQMSDDPSFRPRCLQASETSYVCRSIITVILFAEGLYFVWQLLLCHQVEMVSCHQLQCMCTSTMRTLFRSNCPDIKSACFSDPGVPGTSLSEVLSSFSTVVAVFNAALALPLAWEFPGLFD